MAEAEQLNAKPNIPKGLIKALSIEQPYAKPLVLMPCPGKVGFLRMVWDALLDAPPPAQAALF